MENKIEFLNLKINLTKEGLETNVEIDREVICLLAKERRVDEDVLVIQIAKECTEFVKNLEELFK